MVSCSGFRLWAMMSFILSSSAFAAEAIKIELPCGKAPYVACADLRKRLIEGEGEKVVGFRTMTKELVLGIYEGKIDAKGVDGTGGVRQASQNIGKPPICLPLKISENECKDEYQTNVKSQACPALAKVGQITRDKYFFGLGKGASGSLETTHISGGMALGLSNQAVDIEKEIAANAFTISATSGCNARAQRFRTALRDQTNVKLLADVALCDETDPATCSSKRYFESGMSTLHGAYLYLAKCRLIEEAAKKARSFSLNYAKKIDSDVVQLCFARNRGYPTKMKECYAADYAKWIRSRAKSEFTNLASTCGN